MAETKQKPADSLRTPKPKKKLGLSVPPVLRMPHDDLIKMESPTQPIPTQPNPTQLDPSQPTPSAPDPPPAQRTEEAASKEASVVAPNRDFNKRANSIERDALPSGLFPGTSKKLYDALYLRTRGAINPTRTVQATKRELMEWSGIRSKNTIAINLQLLVTSGLVMRSLEVGDHSGSIYEVKLPEELETHPNPSQPIPTQKLGGDPTQKLGWVGLGNPVENKGTYEPPKTFIKTNEQIDDDEAFAKFLRVLQDASKEVTGKPLSASDKERLAELGELLATELKIAAARTTNVSSMPAFLAEHLRRRLWKVDRRQAGPDSAAADAQGETRSNLTAEQIRGCPDCGGTGMYYPEGFERGVARCGHESLKKAEGGDAEAG